MEHLDDDLNTLDELEEDAIEVKPELQRTENLANRSLRNSTVVDDDPDGKKQFGFTYLELRNFLEPTMFCHLAALI